MPATVLFSSEIWSEFAYLLFVNSALVIALRAQTTTVWWWPCALFVGLAAITRGVGIALVGALVFVLIRRAPRRAWPALSLAVLPLAIVEYLGLGGGSNYLEIFFSRSSSLNAVLVSIATNVASLWGGWVNLFSFNGSATVQVVSLLLLPLVLVGVWQRLRVWALDAVYVGGYAGVVVLWPYPEVIYRLIYPLAPLLVIYSALGARTLCAIGRPALVGHAMLLPPVLLLTCALPVTSHMVWRYLFSELPTELATARPSRYWLAAPDQTTAIRDIELKLAMVGLMRDAGTQIAQEDCIYALDPQAVMLYSRHVSFPPPTGEKRSPLPSCRYHLLLSDRKIAASYRALWQPYEVVLIARVPEGVAGVLVRYPKTSRTLASPTSAKD